MMNADYFVFWVEVDETEEVDVLEDLDASDVVFALWAWVDGGFELVDLERRADVRLGIRLMRDVSISRYA